MLKVQVGLFQKSPTALHCGSSLAFLGTDGQSIWHSCISAILNLFVLPRLPYPCSSPFTVALSYLPVFWTVKGPAFLIFISYVVTQGGIVQIGFQKSLNSCKPTPFNLGQLPVTKLKFTLVEKFGSEQIIWPGWRNGLLCFQRSRKTSVFWIFSRDLIPMLLNAEHKESFLRICAFSWFNLNFSKMTSFESGENSVESGDTRRDEPQKVLRIWRNF